MLTFKGSLKEVIFLPRIEILLRNDGTIKSEGIDFIGDACEEAMSFMDELFGEAEETTQKDEYWDRVPDKELLMESS